MLNLRSQSLLYPHLGTMQVLSQALIHQQGLDFINYSLRGIGQVVFVNNPLSGLIILLALFIQSPWVGLMSLVGVVSSTYAAIALNLERESIRNGIYGYNGLLVGTAISTLGLHGNGSWNFTWAISIILFSILTTILIKVSHRWWVKTFKSPPLTLPFNIITLLFLGLAKFIPGFDFGHLAEINKIPNSLDVNQLIAGIFVGFGQVFLADKFIVGFLIFLAIALCTPIGGMIGLVGSIIGLLTGAILGVEIKDLYLGLSCYNSILAAMAIGGIFYVPNQRSFLLALGGGCLSVFIGQLLAIFLGILGLPILTLPFCIASIFLFVILRQLSPFLVPVSLHTITNPEEHLQSYLDARQAIAYFRFKLERFMFGYSSNFLFNCAETRKKIDLGYIFKAIDTKNIKQISIQQLELYLNETGQLSSQENLEYIMKFIDKDNTKLLDYEKFSEFILRHEYLISKHKPLIDYFLPLDKCQNDFVSPQEINKAITNTNHVPLTKSQIKLLQKRTGENTWTWNQFILVILIV